jgi:predicted MFS family arabinose efflux permease
MLLGLLSLVTFASAYAQLVMVPVLGEIAREFDISLATASLVIAVYGAPGVVVGLLLGPWSDRVGRKPFLVVGSASLGVFTLAAAVAPTFALILILRVLAGAGASVLFPSANAAVGDSLAYRERGRALSVIIASNTVASVVGIPISGILADLVSWRVSLVITGAAVLIASAMLHRFLAIERPTGEPRRVLTLFRDVYSNPSALGLIAGTFGAVIFWIGWSTFIVVFLQQRFGLTTAIASVVALVSGAGVLVGSLTGGRIGDRTGQRPLAYRSILLAAVLILLVSTAPVSLPIASFLIFAASVAMGMRMSANSALMTEQVPSARGTMLAVASSLQSFGVVIGALLGGLIIDRAGFGMLGIVCLTIAIISALFMIVFVQEREAELNSAAAPAGDS